MVDLLIIIALTALLAVAHEAIQGLVMLGFGARPTFGATMVAHLMPALYATSFGHRFTRLEYFVVAASPAILISAIGLWLCSAGLATYLLFLLAVHLGGCVGDGAAICGSCASRVARFAKT